MCASSDYPVHARIEFLRVSEWFILAPGITYDSRDDKSVKEIGAEVFGEIQRLALVRDVEFFATER